MLHEFQAVFEGAVMFWNIFFSLKALPDAKPYKQLSFIDQGGITRLDPMCRQVVQGSWKAHALCKLLDQFNSCSGNLVSIWSSTHLYCLCSQWKKSENQRICLPQSDIEDELLRVHGQLLLSRCQHLEAIPILGLEAVIYILFSTLSMLLVICMIREKLGEKGEVISE